MSQLTTRAPGITFAVDDVTPATAPLPECRAYEAVKQMLDGDIESCSDYHATVVKDIYYQPLLATVYKAFAEHRPLVLTPDAVWLTIAQGVAHHMAIHAERLRSRFVAHQGKLELAFTCDDWVEGSPENPWPDAFASWSAQIRDHVGPATHDLLACDFSTTGPVERAAGDVVMMDVFERYFQYAVYCICGIPAVTLEGTSADWERLREKATGLRVFDLDWWLEHLIPICDQFVRASRGDVDLPHWRNICKLRDDYGGHIINGWIARLFPYLRSFTHGPCDARNPIFETGEGFQTFDAPPGLSRVPFTWRNGPTAAPRHMEAIGGLVGVTQDPQTLALRPKVGWAVRPASKMDVLLARLADKHKAQPTSPRDPSETLAERANPHHYELPADFGQFYHRFSGAQLLAAGVPALHILPQAQMAPLDWGEKPDLFSRGPGGRSWQRFARLADGSWLAINLDINIGLAVDNLPEIRERYYEDSSFAPICHGSPQTQGRPGENPVIALSFAELLERILDAPTPLFWLDPEFKPYGDAEQFTRRP